MVVLSNRPSFLSAAPWPKAEDGNGRVRRAFAGVAAQTIAIPRRRQLAAGTGASGAMIDGIEPGSPADKAGLLARDILVALDGQPIEGVDELLRRLNGEQIGRSVTVSLLRGGRRIDTGLTPAERER